MLKVLEAYKVSKMKGLKTMNGIYSDIAQFRQQQVLLDEATQRGLSGLASGTARHNTIIARMEQDARRVLTLVEQGKLEEAKALMLCDEVWIMENCEEVKA